MRPQVVLVTAPFLSVVRPPLGVSLLQAALERRGIRAVVEPLHVAFAEAVGVDVNEHVAETLPTHLLFGDWVFAAAWRGRRRTESEAGYLAELAPWLDDGRLPPVDALIATAAAFVEQAAARLARHRAAVVGFSSTFQQNLASLAIAQRLRRLRPETFLCLGGANCEGTMGEALLEAYPFLDAVFSGEADDTFPQLVAALLARPPGAAAPVLPRRVVSGTAPVALDELPVPDYRDYFAALDAAPFRARVEVGVMFESSRGCWWGAKRHCRFCGLNGSAMAFRAKRPERVLEELEALAARWGLGRFAAADNILGIKHIGGVFGELERRRPGYRLFYEIKANLGSHQLETLARGGMTWVQPGIESLDDDVLERMDKGVTALQNVRLLRNCAELGIAVVWNLLAGFPGETDAPYRRMAELLPKLEHLDPPTSCTPVRLDRFSPYFERAAELGFTQLAPMPAYAVVYELPEPLLRRLAYFFTGTPAAAAGEEALAPLRRRIGAWRRRMRCDPPVLSLIEHDGLRLVADTRTIAGQPWSALDAVEGAVLNALRDPVEVGAALRRVVAEGAGGRSDGRTAERVEAAFTRLAGLDFVLVDRGRAVSLVVETARRVHPPEAAADLPLGRLLPAAASPLRPEPPAPPRPAAAAMAQEAP
ncbi:MAG TPA: RiPP maturation radical SAM C-methyltransferase [Thermoanaerobaculia bacterium]|nr:RiPP maturation radical SAM C-methyltransferase [Thermoanaerobaculia bacterium]